MRKRNTGDASFMIGLVLGIAIGAAIALIITAEPRDDTFPELNSGAQQAAGQLEESTKTRIEGASEGVA